MANNLVIVESPTKVKSVKKFLGPNYTVLASNGHVRDLPKSSLGIDVEHDFEPKYITIRGKGELVASLKKAASKADKVYLATDPDREGEAISWHLSKALKLDPKKMRRITFNEITKSAVKASLKNARDIDMNLVNEQQARRCLDRMVGYEISPLLWKKIKRGLSAGRVQSVALRIIADREDEINSFIPKEYWTLDADLQVDGMKKPLTAHFYGKDGKKTELQSEEQVRQVLSDLEGESFRVEELKKGERTRKAPLPFTTSTLQQEASRTLNMSTYKTMQVAQQLYEGITLPKEGTVGLISYLRTDSTRISEEADLAARSYIAKQYGEAYSAAGNTANTNKNAQDAHEAIRPTDITRTPVSVKEHLTREQFRLYQLIWKRFTASRMTPARYETDSVKIKAGAYTFTAASSKVIFDGFLSVYAPEEDGKVRDDYLSGITESSSLKLLEFQQEQHFTQPPAHYTEATLVKTLEELGIGRPSTYAPTITTIIARHYVTREKKNLYMTELGEVVNDMMKQAFPSIVDVNFTANMEQLLDAVGDGIINWKTVVENFWPDLEASVQAAEKELDKVKIEDEVSDVICENCGRHMVVKYGPHGKFLACPGFPECRNTKPYQEKIGVSCPRCGGEILRKKTRKGRVYYGCEHYPECEFMSWQQPVSEKCPKCGGYMVIRGNRIACADKECGFVKNREDKD
ncbi:type I DNA topoisomerase [Bilifractor porci]|uniref:DNA topoisomerase 1 n=1 Tax=Bilifractor porci TaxID=2606636 RepID=A0A7X2TPG9_9FIRM|nr:type I DNA topoisomerase [Bilifractor porci]MST81791.1 type I DNA topoisomerase [Bilifractor porci]